MAEYLGLSAFHGVDHRGGLREVRQMAIGGMESAHPAGLQAMGRSERKFSTCQGRPRKDSSVFFRDLGPSG